MFERAPDAIRKLNEAEPLFNIPPGLYDAVRRSLTDPENRKLMLQAQRFYRQHGKDFARAAGSVAKFLAPYAAQLSDDAAVRANIADAALPVTFLDYDWRLNDAGAKRH